MDEVVYLVVIYKGHEIDTIDDQIFYSKKLADEHAYYLNTVMDVPKYEAFVEERKAKDIMGKEHYELKKI
jgi:folate-dependent tRNA-U54 methylase TrmFO/GidA